MESREWVRLVLRLDDMQWRLCVRLPVLMATLMDRLCFGWQLRSRATVMNSQRVHRSRATAPVDPKFRCTSAWPSRRPIFFGCTFNRDRWSRARAVEIAGSRVVGPLVDAAVPKCGGLVWLQTRRSRATVVEIRARGVAVLPGHEARESERNGISRFRVQQVAGQPHSGCNLHYASSQPSKRQAPGTVQL